MKRRFFQTQKHARITLTWSLRREVSEEISKNLSSQNQLMTVATILWVGLRSCVASASQLINSLANLPTRTSASAGDFARSISATIAEPTTAASA